MRILVIEDNAEDVHWIRRALTLADIGPFELTWADRLATGLGRLAAAAPDLVLLDLSLPDSRGAQTFHRVQTAAPHVPVLVLAEVPDAAVAMETTRRAGQEYLVKQQVHGDPTLLGHAIRYLLDRVQREQDLERQRREVETLALVTRSINSTLDLPAVLARVADSAARLTGAGGTAVAVRDPDGDALVFRHVAGGSYAGALGHAVDPERGTAREVLASGLPFRTDHYTEDRRVLPDPLVTLARGEVLAQLVVPIISQEALEGLLYAEHRGGLTFGDHDELVLLRLADHAAIAIRNARLFARESSARAAAQESETLFRTLFASAPLPMWLVDADALDFVAVNDAAVELYGYGAEEFLRLREPDIDAGTTRPDPPGPRRRETQHRTRGGRAVDVEVVSHPVTLGARRLVLSVVHDVTGRKRAEAALRESDERLRQAQRLDASGRMAATIARGLNEIFTVVSTAADLIRDLGPGDVRARKHVESVRAATARGIALTSELLAFGQEQPRQPVPLDLNAVVADLLETVRRLAGEGVQVTFTPGRAPARVRADPRQVEQLVVTLVVNARDAMPEGGHLIMETLAAVLDARFVERHPGLAPGPYVVLAVSDTGHGMAPEVCARVFDPFFTTKTERASAGLGLSGAYGVVRQSGGDILVYSEPGRGTTFKVYLPRLEHEPAQAPGAPSPARLQGSETVLVVDDEVQVREVAVDALEWYGYTVLEARHVQEAITISERHAGPIHLLVTDVVMPDLTGPELAARLLAIRADLRVLYTSGYTDAAIGRHGVLPPGTPFLEKPYSAAGLAAKVREVLAAPEQG